MLAALLDDKTGFVELFLQNGLSLREFLTPQILCQLYTGVSCVTADSSHTTRSEKQNALSFGNFQSKDNFSNFLLLLTAKGLFSYSVKFRR